MIADWRMTGGPFRFQGADAAPPPALMSNWLVTQSQVSGLFSSGPGFAESWGEARVNPCSSSKAHFDILRNRSAPLRL